MASGSDTSQSIELIPVERGHILAYLAELREELVDCIDHSGNWVTVDDVAQAVLTGMMSLYVASYEKQYAGFVIAERIATAKGEYINLPFAHSNPHLWGTVDVMKEALAIIEEQARSLGMKGVFLSSLRKGYDRRVKPMGYTQDIARWVKEV